MAENESTLADKILRKGGLSKDVTDKTFTVLQMLKSVLQKVDADLRKEVVKSDPRIRIQYKDRGTFEAELKVADDLLIFIMHTNSFVFDTGHPVWKNSYVSLDHARGTVGIISIYNFLADSFKFDRKNDTGNLLARIFVNKEGHFFVEGKKQMGILFNDFGGKMIGDADLRQIVELAIAFSIDIDLDVPAFDSMKEITVYDAMINTMQSTVSTSKRLGFKFETESSPE